MGCLESIVLSVVDSDDDAGVCVRLQLVTPSHSRIQVLFRTKWDVVQRERRLLRLAGSHERILCVDAGSTRASVQLELYRPTVAHRHRQHHQTSAAKKSRDQSLLLPGGREFA